MGREIRRVPPNWEHPRYTHDNAPRSNMVGQLIGMRDQEYDEAAREWIEGFDLWRQGKHESQSGKYASTSKYYWEYDTPPEELSYRPRFDAEPTWYQVYETVSDGTPVTPPFATQDELIDYLVNVGEMAGTQYNRKSSRAAATKFVKEMGWVPSMIVENGPSGVTFKEGIEAAV